MKQSLSILLIFTLSLSCYSQKPAKAVKEQIALTNQLSALKLNMVSEVNKSIEEKITPLKKDLARL